YIRHSISAPFPYTTLFRSDVAARPEQLEIRARGDRVVEHERGRSDVGEKLRLRDGIVDQEHSVGSRLIDEQRGGGYRERNESRQQNDRYDLDAKRLPERG